MYTEELHCNPFCIMFEIIFVFIEVFYMHSIEIFLPNVCFCISLFPLYTL